MVPRFAHVSALGAAIVAASLGTSAPARAQSLVDAPTPIEPTAPAVTQTRALHPVAVRGELNLLYDGVFGAGDMFGGVTVAYSIDPRLSVEGTFGWGGDSFGSTGANLMAMGRYAFPLDRAGVHAFTFALGPSTFFGGDYGAVFVARGEFAYELRTRSGFSLLVGGGPSLVLADSKSVRRDCGWFCPGGDVAQFKAGDVPVYVRASAGWSF